MAMTRYNHVRLGCGLRFLFCILRHHRFRKTAFRKARVHVQDVSRLIPDHGIRRRAGCFLLPVIVSRQKRLKEPLHADSIRKSVIYIQFQASSVAHQAKQMLPGLLTAKFFRYLI